MSSFRSASCLRRRALRGLRGGLRRRLRGVRGLWRRRGLPSSRCRMRSVGCGSWTVLRATARRLAGRATRSRWRCGLSGELDRAALQGALNDLVVRHESLRTVFPERGWGAAAGGSGAGREVALAVSAVSEAALPGALSAAAGRGFALSRELPLRAHLYALSANRARAAAWCCTTLPATAGRCVRCGGTWRSSTGRGGRGLRRGCLSCRVQYADYTLWQRAVLGVGGATPPARWRGSLSYWRGALAELAGSDRAAVRPVASCGVEPPRGQRAAAH